jgi:hypothetical protein
MKTIGRLSFFAIAAACLASAAGPAPQNLFPTGVGSTWNYQGTMNGASVSIVATIKSAKTSNGVTEATFDWQMAGRSTQMETYRVTSTSVERTRSGAGGANHLNPPLPVIKYPMSVGKAWHWKGSLVNGATSMPSSGDLRVGALEKVKTGAGTFTAYRVDVKLLVSAGGQTAHVDNSYWYAPGAGMVKQSATVSGTGQSVQVEAAISSYKIK